MDHEQVKAYMNAAYVLGINPLPELRRKYPGTWTFFSSPKEIDVFYPNTVTFTLSGGNGTDAIARTGVVRYTPAT